VLSNLVADVVKRSTLSTRSESASEFANATSNRGRTLDFGDGKMLRSTSVDCSPQVTVTHLVEPNP
jgi:hypothetical protein